MMFRILDVLFACGHRRLTFPMTTGKGTGQPRRTYVACLDCGKEFAYDWSLMKMISKQDKAPEPAAESALVNVHAA